MVSPRARWFGRTRGPILIGSSLVVVMVVGLFAAGTSAVVSAAPLAPASGALFGAYVQPPAGSSLPDGVAAFESKLGRKLAIVNKYHDWSLITYKDEKTLIGSGHIVMVSWHPPRPGDPALASKIVSGQYDSLIRGAADNLKALGSAVLLRWDFEMTQPPGSPEYIGSPAEFIAAWRHMHDIFVARGATNVLWVWAPQSSGFTDGTAPGFYPGDGYVDWIEASDVMGGHTWPTFAKLFTPTYTWAAPRGKPLMVWVGLPENPSDPNWKANWLTGMQASIETSMPAVKAVLYFDAANTSGDFLADTSPKAWAAFRSMALDLYFNPGSAGSSHTPTPTPTPTSTPTPNSSTHKVHGAGRGRGLVTKEKVPLAAEPRAGGLTQEAQPHAFGQPPGRDPSARGSHFGLVLLVLGTGLIGIWLIGIWWVGHRGLGITVS
jgi:hypothetical protein